MYQYQSIPRQYVVYNHYNSSILHQGSVIPEAIKKLLKDEGNNLIRFDSVGEFKCYLALKRKYGKHNVKVHYKLKKYQLDWIVDFYVDGILYEYKCKQDDKRFNANLQTLADYYPKILQSLIIVSPNLTSFTVMSNITGKGYNLKCLKINEL